MIYGVSERPCSNSPRSSRPCIPLAHGQQVGNVGGFGDEHLNAKATVVDDEHQFVIPGVLFQDLKRLGKARLVKANKATTIPLNPPHRTHAELTQPQ